MYNVYCSRSLTRKPNTQLPSSNKQYPGEFVIAADHPFNPHVYLKSTLSPEDLETVLRGGTVLQLGTGGGGGGGKKHKSKSGRRRSGGNKQAAHILQQQQQQQGGQVGL